MGDLLDLHTRPIREIPGKRDIVREADRSAAVALIMSGFVGMTVVHANHMFMSLRESGFIQLDGKELTATDVERLMRMSGLNQLPPSSEAARHLVLA